MDKKNIIGWEEVISKPSTAYKKWFDDEKRFLIKNIKKDSLVLEVGCGNGRSLKDLKEVTTHLVGIDHDETAVNDAKKNLDNIKGVKIILADGKNIPFNDNTFDAVICMSTFANFYKDKFKILSEMRRVVKEDGNIFISVYSEDALEERLKAYKSANLNIKEVLPNGCVVFNDFREDGFSEQFSKIELRKIFKKANLKIVSIYKSSIAYLCQLRLDKLK